MSEDDKEGDRPRSDASSPEDQTSDRHRLDEAVDVAHVNSQLLTRLADSNETLALAMVEMQVRAKIAAEREEKAEAARQEEREAREEERARFRWTKRFLIMFACIVIIILLIGQSYLIWAQYQANKSANAGRAEIHDCVVAGGECYKRQQANTGEVVGGLTLNGIYADVCTQEYKNIKPIQAEADAVAGCVDRLTKAHAKVPTTKAKRTARPTSSPAIGTDSASATAADHAIGHPTVSRPDRTPIRTVTPSPSATPTRTTAQPPSPSHAPGLLPVPRCTITLAGIRVC